MFELRDFEQRLDLKLGPLVFHFGDEVVGPSFVQLPAGGGGTPCLPSPRVGEVRSRQ